METKKLEKSAFQKSTAPATLPLHFWVIVLQKTYFAK